MAIASTSRTIVGYVPETTFGVTPATPAWQKFRRTGGNLDTVKTTVMSEEVRGDRNVVDELQVAQDVKGSYDYEFSYGTFDALLAAALGGTWTTNALVNGSSAQSFSFEESVDLGGSKTYNRFSGVMVDEVSLNIDSRAVIKGSMSLMGIAETQATTIVTGATYVEPNTEIIATELSVANLVVSGLVTPLKVKNLKLAIKNNLRIQDVVGSLNAVGFGIGQCDITGSVDVFVEGIEAQQAMLAHSAPSISFTIGAVTNKKYSFLIPQARLLSGVRKLGGNRDDVMLSIPFRGIYDATTGGSIKILRAVA